jgi:hypothetical protein
MFFDQAYEIHIRRLCRDKLKVCKAFFTCRFVFYPSKGNNGSSKVTNETIKLILSLSLSGSILAVLIFIAKPFIKHKLSKSIQYYLWIVVLVRFIIPFSFEGSIMNDVFYSNRTPVEISSQGAAQHTADTSGNIINSSISPNVQENVTNGVYNGDADHSRYLRDLFNQYALYLWLAGVIVSLIISFQSVESSFMNGNLYLMTPPDAGEYVYCLVLNFKDRGTVSYGFNSCVS